MNKKNIKILFTHDLHDRVLPYKIIRNNKVLELGGFARLQSAINDEKKDDPDLLLIDAGDFSMGTLFQSIYASDSPELRLLGQMNYDVVTLGNHEYDFRADGLANSLNAAKKSGDNLPKIVQSNVVFPKDKNGNLSPSLTKLKKAMDNYGVKRYTVLERKGIKIGVFGLMGKGSADDAPMSEVKFDNIVKSAKDVVNTLKHEEKVDLIICLSHSGLNKNKLKSEDEVLARTVPDIDVIISGHTHTKLSKPIIVGNTIIAACKEYCEYLGVINISQNSKDSKKTWNLDSYNLKQINNTIKDDKYISQTVNNFKKIVQKKYLDNFDMKFDEVIAKSSFDFIPVDSIGVENDKNTLGNLIGDSYIYATQKAEDKNYETVTAAIVPSGIIRGSFIKGDITVSDIFTVSPLGVGPDGIAGYPLISVYLTGRELKTICKADNFINLMMNGIRLYIVGIKYGPNSNKLVFNKFKKSIINKSDYSFYSLEKINNKKLYRVVAGLYTAQMLAPIKKQSFGLLAVAPKDRYGEPITDFESHIIKDNNNNEIKEWFAIAEYMKSFDKINGISQIPQCYNKNK